MGKNQKVGGSIPKSRPSSDHDSFTVEGRDCFAADGKEVSCHAQESVYYNFYSL